jgi:hypothetical protein
MSDTVSATPGTERPASAAAHCATAEDEFARARQVSEAKAWNEFIGTRGGAR